MAQFTKYTGNVVGAAGSLITALDAALVTGQGWDNTFAGGGANKKIYRPAGGNRFYYRVDDAGTGTGGAKEALIRGAETWTDIDTPNLNPFPSAAQSALTANSLVLRKSADAGTNRAYKIFCDDRTAIIFIQSEAATWYMGPWIIGDFYSRVTADGYRSCLIARGTENSGLSTTPEPFQVYDSYLTQANAQVGRFMARSYLGTGTSAICRILADGKVQGSNSASTFWRGVCKAPNAPDGMIASGMLEITELTGGNYYRRGWHRGLRNWCCDTQPYADGDSISGVGTLAGRTYEIVTPLLGVGAVNTALVETSNTLDTN